MYNEMKNYNSVLVKRIMPVILTMVIVCSLTLTGCEWAGLGSKLDDLQGSITGNTYRIEFYSNTGEQTMFTSGTNISLSDNVVKEKTYNSEDGWGYTETLSSVITITIDGHEIETCGDTVIFAEDGLQPNVNFSVDSIESEADSLGDNPIFAKTINRYRNMFGKSRVVVIKSQLGNPICAYSGDDVHWEVCDDLPKTTKLYVDNKALYVHRANFQIIDLELINQ